MHPHDHPQGNDSSSSQPLAVRATPLILVLLSLVLLVGYQLHPAWQQQFNPVFAAFIFGLAAVLVLGLSGAGQQYLKTLSQPTAKQALAFWQQQALRWGIVLFALNISPTALLNIELWQLFKLLCLVVTVLGLALWLGHRWFHLPPAQVLLVSAGISFCGTSAIFATHALRLPAHDDHSAQADLTQSLAALLLAGLLALGMYSLLLHQSWLDRAELAWLIGSTAPEVAQAVAVGTQLAEQAPQAIIAKLSRVCLLLPFLCGLSLLCHKQLRQRKREQHNTATLQNKVVFPWFILLFVVLLLSQLLLTLPDWLQQIASAVSEGCLVFAMLATGLQTRVQDLRQCRVRLFGFAALLMLLLFGLALLLR